MSFNSVNDMLISDYNFFNSLKMKSGKVSSYHVNLLSSLMTYLLSAQLDLGSIANFQTLLSSDSNSGQFVGSDSEKCYDNGNGLLSICNSVMSPEYMVYPVQVIINQPFNQVIYACYIYTVRR